MKKLIVSVCALLALFSVLRAWTAEVPLPSAGVSLHPGLVEVSDGRTSVDLAFGIAHSPAGPEATWSVLPLRLALRDGDRTVSVSLNGLSFLLRGGVSVGRERRIGAAYTGDVISVGGKVNVDARVDGDVWTLGADVALGPRAEVTGSVVALGGKVTQAPKAVVRGSVNAMPEVKIPFLGILGTELSVPVLAFGRQLLSFVLLAAALFLVAWFATPRARELYDDVTRSWRSALVISLAALVLVPLLTALLVVSVIGVVFLPVIAVALLLLGLEGFLVACARIGGALRRSLPDGARPLALFTSGLLGIFLVKLPALVGIFLALLRSPGAAAASQVLQLVTLGLTLAGFAYGAGASLASRRARAARG